MQNPFRLLVPLMLVFTAMTVSAAEFYFPHADEDWEKVSPVGVGWDAALLSAALDVAGDRKSSGVVILHNGRIMAERYWSDPDSSRAYKAMLQGVDGEGRAIEDVASAQKNVTSVLAGMAQERGFLKLDDSVSKYLGVGWSKAGQHQESAITLRHLITMTSGLTDDLSFEAEPGTKWFYNTPAYHLIMRIVSKATGKDRHLLTREWITEPLGMQNSSWTPRPWAKADIAVGFSTTARELARFGLMIQAGGRWHDQVILGDTDFITDMMTPSQALNPSYGYLWWLNGQEFSLIPGPRAQRRDGQMIATAPKDLVAMQGALDRKLYLVPSLNLIVTRLGAVGKAEGTSFNDAFWAALMKARL